MCIVCISKRVHVPPYTHFPTTGYARVLLFMFIRRELAEERFSLHTVKCIYWKYVVVAELSKLTYVED